MTLTQIQAFPVDRVRALFGLEPAALGALLTAVLPELAARRLAEQTAKQNRKRGPGSKARPRIESAAPAADGGASCLPIVLALEPAHPGPLSDKVLYEKSEAATQYPRAARRADPAYLGVPEMILPHKRVRGKAGEKAKDLTPAQKAENQHLASMRVPVEHGVRRCKAWRILRDEFRLGRGLFCLVATVGLVHLARLCPGA